jgi:hypothetical protein
MIPANAPVVTRSTGDSPHQGSQDHSEPTGDVREAPRRNCSLHYNQEFGQGRLLVAK